MGKAVYWEEELEYEEMPDKGKIKIAKTEKSWAAARNGQTAIQG